MTKHRESKILPGGQIIMCGQKELKGEDRAQLSEETYYMKIHINIHYKAKMCYTFMPDHSCCVKIRSSEGRPGRSRSRGHRGGYEALLSGDTGKRDKEKTLLGRAEFRQSFVHIS